MEPIKIWKEIINSETTEQEMQRRLAEIYRDNQPFIAEIIMNSHCPSRCLHCIYAPDFDRYNRNMNSKEWESVFRLIYNKIGLRRFIFDGRALTKECLQAIRLLKKGYPSVKVGLITDGLSIDPFMEDLIDCPPDWIDISVDGLETDHDKQRSQPGAYRITIDNLIQLKESAAFEKINILACLTTLNIKSISAMIRALNGMGFKNFFITPVSILKGYRPDPGLQPKGEDFIQWLEELMQTAKGLSDSWVEVDIYDALYAGAIKQLIPDLFRKFETNHDHMELLRKYGDNEFYICYYPASITGVRELIVNSDGNIIPPKIMAMGNIPENLVMGNILRDFKPGTLLDKTNGKNVLALFFEELIEEKHFLTQ